MPWTHFFAASVRYVLGSALVVLITCSIPASANFVFARNGPLGPPAACSFDRVYNFSFLGNANFADPGLVGWTVNLKDTAPPPPPFPEPSEVDLNILAAHRPDMVVPAGPCDVGANLRDVFPMPLIFPQPLLGAGLALKGIASIIPHGAQASDIFRATARAGGINPPELEVTGRHVVLDGVLTASVKAGVTPLKHIIIRPTYFDPITMTTQTGDPIPEGDLAPGEEHKGIPLPRHEILAPFRSLVATDYTVDATGSPLTETTLAFLGTEDGSPAELPLAEFTELFGFTEFVVPLLRAADNMTNLFIGVDLTQWLSDPRPFAVGDVFSFVNGVDPDLPGFLVGTSPISFSSEFITNTYTGDTVVVASIDGTVVPEPGSALLLLTGLIGLRLLGAGRGRFSCSRASEYSAKHYAIGANQGARKSCANFGAPAIAGGG